MCKITKDKAFLLIFAFLSLILILMLLAISQATIREIDYENVIMNNNTQKQINLLNERVMKLEKDKTKNKPIVNAPPVVDLIPGDCSPYVSLLEEVGDGEVEEEIIEKLEENVTGKACRISTHDTNLEGEWPEWTRDMHENLMRTYQEIEKDGWKRHPYDPDGPQGGMLIYEKDFQILYLYYSWTAENYNITYPRNFEKFPDGKDVTLTFIIDIGIKK